MSENKLLRIWINRVVAFLFGGLFIFVVMQLTVVNNLSGLNNQIEKELDEIKYEPGRILLSGQTYFENNDYTNAKMVLSRLFERHPVSEEATEGHALYLVIEKKQEEMDKKWAEVSPGIREEWEKRIILQWRNDLKEQYQEDSEELEKNLDSKIESEWNSVQKKLRQKWESEI